MTCSSCDSNNVFQSKLMGSASGTTGFFLEPAKGGLIKRGVEVEVHVCDDCGHVMFVVSSAIRAKVFRAG